MWGAARSSLDGTLMAGIPDEKVQEVRDRVDIVDLIGRYVELRRQGRNFKGLCPFHSERSPSFNVNPARKGYKCFGCGVGGDAIRFVMELEGKSFPEAVGKLADMYGVNLPKGSARHGGDRTAKDDAYALMRAATDLYREVLQSDADESAVGRAYLSERGIGEETAAAFELGYAPAPDEAGWDRLTRALQDASLDLGLADKLGLVAKSDRSGSYYDRFRGRLMFPVVQPGGEVIAFSGRIVPPHDQPTDDRPVPKYTNSPETLLYSKGRVLFGLSQARRAMHAAERAILVEGNVDVLKLHQWELGETVAPLGTALTDDQAKLLGRFTKKVVLCFDGDAAGKKAAWKALPVLMAHDFDVRMVLLPDGQDPDSLGRDRLVALLENPKSALEEMMTRIAAKAGNGVDARAQGLDRVIPLIASAPRSGAREMYANVAAALFDLPLQQIAGRIRAYMNRPRSDPRSNSRSGSRSNQRSDQRSRSGGGPRGGDPRDSIERPDGPPEYRDEPGRGDPRDFHSPSGPPMPVSAAMVSVSPLPNGQAQLTTLLVDLPHLASVARRSGALACISDPRLEAIVTAVIEGAEAGQAPTMPDLLGLVDEAEQRQIHDEVLSGRFRGEGEPDDPKALLDELVFRCREQVIDHDIRRLDQEFIQASREGDVDRARELQMEKLAMRRQQQQLRLGAELPAATPQTSTDDSGLVVPPTDAPLRDHEPPAAADPGDA
ncbi:MAG: DNA primase [Myxococcota bacterium]